MAEWREYRANLSVEGWGPNAHLKTWRTDGKRWEFKHEGDTEWFQASNWDSSVENGELLPFNSYTDADLAMALQLADLLCKGDLWADDPVGQWLRSRVQRELLSRGAK